MALTKKQKRMIRTWLEKRYADEPHPDSETIKRDILEDENGIPHTSLHDRVMDAKKQPKYSEAFWDYFQSEVESWRDEQFDE